MQPIQPGIRAFQAEGALDLPLLRLDMGRMFAASVGQSEHNARQLTTIIDRLAPCVVWLDEVDKGLAGLSASRSDAGTGGRVLATLLTWLNDREDEYNGSLENRLRFPLRVIDAARAAVPPGFLVGIRMSVDECRVDGLVEDDAVEILQVYAEHVRFHRRLGGVPRLTLPEGVRP